MIHFDLLDMCHLGLTVIARPLGAVDTVKI